MNLGIRYLHDLSAACANELHELCEDVSCEDYCHDQDDLEPLDLTPEQDQASVIEFDTRARRRADR